MAICTPFCWEIFLPVIVSLTTCNTSPPSVSDCSFWPPENSNAHESELPYSQWRIKKYSCLREPCVIKGTQKHNITFEAEKVLYDHFRNRKGFDGSSSNDDSVFTCNVTGPKPFCKSVSSSIIDIIEIIPHKDVGKIKQVNIRKTPRTSSCKG